DTQLKINFSTPLESTKVMGSPAILRVILNNLLSNVVKYGKNLDQRSNFYQRKTLPTCEVSITSEDSYYLIGITDQGDGMTPEEIQSLLDLEKAKVRLEKHTATELQIPGSGLGLRIVMKAVEKLGGEFGIDSDPGLGSTFWFKIPKVEE
ncbi:MAG: HAMP domain-containing sensor histidine kinase, partial [Melioribacteraceae bacterium]